MLDFSLRLTSAPLTVRTVATTRALPGAPFSTTFSSPSGMFGSSFTRSGAGISSTLVSSRLAMRVTSTCMPSFRGVLAAGVTLSSLPSGVPRISKISPTVRAGRLMRPSSPPSFRVNFFGVTISSSMPSSGISWLRASDRLLAASLRPIWSSKEPTVSAVVSICSCLPSMVSATVRALRTVILELSLIASSSAGVTIARLSISTPADFSTPSTSPDMVLAWMMSPLTSRVTDFCPATATPPPTTRVASMPPVAIRSGVELVLLMRCRWDFFFGDTRSLPLLLLTPFRFQLRHVMCT